ncbi:MAG: serpin family protein [Bacteroidaceae bacterium]|nr:serpin family protein [Bacteroidaceae bacterium]
MKKIFYIIAMAVTIASCGTTTQSSLPDAQNTQLTNSDRETTRKANKFSLKLFAQTYKNEKDGDNFCVSPLSASLALSMAANGAEGTTREQMYTTLGFSDTDVEKINAHQKKTIGRLSTLDPERVTLNIANSMWVNENFKIKKGFEKNNTKFYDATVKNIKFDAAAVNAINDWCAQKTKGKISEIIKEIDPMAQLFLINAIYFNSRWTTVFNKENTKEEEFTKENGEKVKVQMMFQNAKIPYYENDYMQMAAKSFGDEYFEMLFILPREGVTMDRCVELLADSFDTWNKAREKEEVNLSLPRYKAEYGTSLKKTLQSMGMSDAFTPGKANFDALSAEALCIGNVLQKTFVKVDEEGAEAAAVTSVSLETMSLGPPQPKNMVLNRPFIYIIRDRGAGNILFIGKNGYPKE